VRTAAARVEAQAAAGGNALLHERLVCDGVVRELDGTLLHYSFPDARTYREKYARYTAIEALAQPPSVLRTVSEAAMVLPRFGNGLLRRGALRDGPRGWYVAWHSALYNAVVAWKSLRQAGRDRKKH
jgi:hypothetical protein